MSDTIGEIMNTEANKSIQFRYSDRVAENDYRHQVCIQEEGSDHEIVPYRTVTIYDPVKKCNHIVFQYSPTIKGKSVAYDPPNNCEGNFMSCKFQVNNNCYAYAVNMATNSFAQPG